MRALPIIVEAKAKSVAEEALLLATRDGGWMSTSAGKIHGFEADGCRVEIHTRFSGAEGAEAVGERHRYQAAMRGRPLPKGFATLVVRDECEDPALLAVLDHHMEVTAVARFREGGWIHEVEGALRGVPAFVARDDAKSVGDLKAAAVAVREVAATTWPEGCSIVFLGVCMSVTALWSHRTLLPLVLAETLEGNGMMDIYAGSEDCLTGVCIGALKFTDPTGFSEALKAAFSSWRTTSEGTRTEVWVDLSKGRELLGFEMDRLRLGGLDELNVRVALMMPDA